jgi:hypothetical protein
MGEQRFEATTLEGFVQQVAVCYIGRGYFFYVTGWIPRRKDPQDVDRKLVKRYGLHVSKWARARRKRGGVANVQYIRLGRFFALLATEGKHRFFVDESPNIRDARRVSLKVGGYSISYRGGHPHVRIRQDEYLGLKAYLVDLAVRRSSEDLESEFAKLPFEPYAPVREQLFVILRAVNRARKAAGLEPVPSTSIRRKRRIYRPYEKQGALKREPATRLVPGGFIYPSDVDPLIRRSLLGVVRRTSGARLVVGRRQRHSL